MKTGLCVVPSEGQFVLVPVSHSHDDTVYTFVTISETILQPGRPICKVQAVLEEQSKISPAPFGVDS